MVPGSHRQNRSPLRRPEVSRLEQRSYLRIFVNRSVEGLEVGGKF